LELTGTDEVLAAIAIGAHDDRIEEIADAVRDRIKKLAKLRFDELEVGDEVVFNGKARPKYLQGARARVTKKKQSKVVVELYERQGRFPADSPITTPVEIVTKV